MASVVTVPMGELPPHLRKVAEGVVRLYAYGSLGRRVVEAHYARSARYESPVHILLGRSSIEVLASTLRRLAGKTEAQVKHVTMWTSPDNPYFSISMPILLRLWVHNWALPFVRFIGGPEYARATVMTTLVVDTQTDKVVLHSDTWAGPSFPAWLKLLLGSWTLPLSILLSL